MLVKSLGAFIMKKNKPKIFKQDGWWACKSLTAIGIGYSPAIAYKIWETWVKFRKL